VPARVVQTREAAADLVGIARWTIRTFGPDQGRRYVAAIEATILALARMPDIIGARRRPDLGAGIWSIRAGHGRARSRHFLVFAYGPGDRRAIVTIIRILHDSMDPARHLPGDDPDPP
jgi:plasmid stabilization system protein ParE